MLSAINSEIKINIREVYRYLGYKGTTPEPEVEAKVKECLDRVVKDSDLRGMYECYPLVFHGEDCFSIEGVTIKSKDLAANLKGCKEVYLMGATIGVGIDRLIARAEITDIASAAIYQAIGAAYIEDYCDAINEEIKERAKEKGMITRPRFSPGYGDFGLEHQRELFSLMKLSKHVGIGLNESLVMSPSKSVTAIIGAKPEGAQDEAREKQEQKNQKHKCSECGMTTCPYRTE